MRTILIILLLAVMVFAVLPTPVQAIDYCEYAHRNPTYWVICYWQIMMDMWDPLDWGDGDADDYGSGSVLIEEVLFYCYNRTDYSYSRIPRAG
jgi:hypothetical protein